MIALRPDPSQYQQQLQEKCAHLKHLFGDVKLPEWEIFPSQPLHFRHRADFAIWHDGDKSHFATFPQGRDGGPHYHEDFPIASASINHLMTELQPRIESNPTLRSKLFQISFHTTLQRDALVTFAYHKPLDDRWRQEAEHLYQALNVQIVGRSHKKKIVLGRDYVEETFKVNDKTLHYQQPEGCFTQSNALICQDMLNWVDQVMAASPSEPKDLLELYCGNGNFTLALAPHFRKVLATELVKQLTAVANSNCDLNQINNVNVVRLSAEEVVDAIRKVRPFRRLKEIDLDNFQFSTIFLDPPRSGLDPVCRGLGKGFDHILYVSCNPETLKHDLDYFNGSHTVERFALFDQFPYTEHVECGVSLRKR
jgi:tRNA (uracil-5-)-methyltransferase